MAVGRQKIEWDRGAFFIARIHLSLTGQVIDYTTLIPEQFREKPMPKRVATPEEQALETKLGIQLLGGFLGDRR